MTPGLTTVSVPLEDVGYRALRAAVDEEWDADAGPAARSRSCCATAPAVSA